MNNILLVVTRGVNLSFISNSLLDETVQLHFTILEETSESFQKFNASKRSLLIKFNSSGE